MKSSNRSILIDADVISHFVTANEAHALSVIFPDNQIYILDKVHAELQNWPSARMRAIVSDLLSKDNVRLMNFPEENEIIKKEYAWIKSKMFKGDGESACLAVARHNKNILASSNLRDIKPYCTMHGIDYLTTMDFLCRALQGGIFDEIRCNKFIATVRMSGGKLPVKLMKEHSCRPIVFLE
jgi:hypothetical protein